MNKNSALKKISDTLEEIFVTTLQDDKTLDSPMTVLAENFVTRYFDGNISVNKLLDIIDRNSQACQVFGYEFFRDEIKGQIIDNLHLETVKTIYLPLSINGQSFFFILTMKYFPLDKMTSFSFYKLDTSAINIESLFFTYYHDKLTGLFNYTTLGDHLKGNIHDELYVCLFDLDHFKKVNDQLGHEKGDSLLKSIGEFLIKISNSKAIYYHRSGDEFVFVSFEKEKDKVVSIINSIQSFIAESSVSDIKLSASFGVCHYKNPCFYKGQVTDIRYTVNIADKAMYKAKQDNSKIVFVESN